MTTLTIPSVAAAPFVMVEAGARDTPLDGAIRGAFPHLQVIGFEPDPDECRRLAARHGPPHRFFPVAVGASTGMRPFYRARYPWYSSLSPPNEEFLADYWEGVLRFATVERSTMPVVDLDSYLPTQGIDEVDFWQLDIQGGELDALAGARSFLAGPLLGLRVEVSFHPMYAGQPLFADIDAFVRPYGFALWDLYTIPHKLHRRGLPPSSSGGGQLASGDALYLRNHRCLTERGATLAAEKLAVLASGLGFHDYAVQIGQELVASGQLGDEAPLVADALRSYVAALLHG